MPRARRKRRDTSDAAGPGDGGRGAVPTPDVIRRAYAGKYVAWAPGGLRIVAVAGSFDAAEKEAAKAGYPMVAVALVPKGRAID